MWAAWANPIEVSKAKSANTPRSVIAYGEKIPGWDADHDARKLNLGVEYVVEVATTDGRTGKDRFTFGWALPDCVKNS